MELTPTRLTRLQLIGTLGIVFILASAMAGTFLFMHWRDFGSRQARLEQDAVQRSHDYLQALGDHTATTLEAQRTLAVQTLRQRIREEVNEAHAMATAIWRAHGSQPMTPALRREIIAALRPLRFSDNRGYIFVDTTDGHCVLLPPNPEYEGLPILGNQDDQGRFIMQILLETVRNPEKAGFATYRWYLPGTRTMDDKIAYVRLFEPAGWLIGSGEYVRIVEQTLQEQTLQTLGDMQPGRHGSMMVIDSDGIILMDRLHPANAGLPLRALQGAQRTQAEAYLATGSRGGFVQDPGNHPEGQVAYVRQLKDWGWTLVTRMPKRVFLEEQNKAAEELARTLQIRMALTVLLTLLALLVAGLFSWLFVRWMNALFARYRRDLVQSHQELKAQSRELLLSRFMIDRAADLTCLVDSHDRPVYLNDIARACFDPHGRDPDRALERLFDTRGQTLPATYEVVLDQTEGMRTFEVTQYRIDYEGEHYRTICARDITARVQADHQLRLAAEVFESSNEAILIADPDSRILRINQAFTRTTGYSPEEVLGQKPSILASGHHSRAFYDEMWRIIDDKGQWSGEIWNRRKNGEIFPEWLNVSVLRDAHGDITHYIALFTDISERKAQEARVRHLAEYDFLTDLPNRALVHDRLQQAINAAHRNQNPLAVLFIDLDHFKNVNDTLGHGIGDELLKDVARRIERAVRDMDTVGRTGGDEFVLLMPSLNDPDEAAQVACRVLSALQQPYLIRDHSLLVSASIGISLYPDDGDNIQSLLMNADLAMYHAKASGRNTFQFYDRQMNAQISERQLLEAHLREALQEEALHVLYQPQYAMDGTTLVGCEALLRWHHPQQGAISPVRFIPVAEESGLIVPIGRWVLQQACLEAARWHASGLPTIPVAVNVSARQLARHDFIDDVEAALRHAGLPGALLELEVTESTLMEDPEHAARQLARIKALGVRLAVDDFGTGYSSLAYLKRFAPDTVKIDRSFVSDLPEDSENAAIVSAIINLADALGMSTLAEGVETEAQRHYLQRLGCHCLQGFLAGSPQAPEAILRELERGASRPAPALP